MPFSKPPKSSRDFLRDPNSAADTLREILREPSLASNIYREQFPIVDMLREIVRQQSRSLEMVHEHLHPLNSFSELKRKITTTETSSFAESYQSAVTLARFYNAGITRNSVQDFLQGHASLSEQVEKLIKTSEFLTAHNILIPANPVDILNAWLDEQSEQNEKSVFHRMVFLTESVSDKKKIPSPNFKLSISDWISIVLAILAMAQGCENEVNIEKIHRALEEVKIMISEQDDETKRLISNLENDLAKQSAEDRTSFLSTVREEVQRIQELDDKASSESGEEID